MNPTKSLFKFPDSFTKEDNCSGQLAVSSWQSAVGSQQLAVGSLCVGILLWMGT